MLLLVPVIGAIELHWVTHGSSLLEDGIGSLDFAGDDDTVNPKAELDDTKDDYTDDQVPGSLENLLGRFLKLLFSDGSVVKLLFEVNGFVTPFLSGLGQ